MRSSSGAFVAAEATSASSPRSSTGFTPWDRSCLAGPLFHRLEDAHDVLRFYREFAATAPDELTTIVELEPRRH